MAIHCPRLPGRKAWLVLAASVSCAAIGRAQDQSITPFSKQKAEALLREHLPCLGCHKLNGEGGAIGPDLTTVRQRRSAAYVTAMIADPQRVVPGSIMPRTLMPASTRDLITRYLVNQDAQGAALYAKWCAACHGTTGRGDGPNADNLPVKPAAHASREAMSARPDDSLYDTIAGGGAVMNRSPRMPAFGATLTPGEIHALVRHIRSLCGCEGPQWSRKP
jgi:mono/diheme cytochrome c family protein